MPIAVTKSLIYALISAQSSAFSVDPSKNVQSLSSSSCGFNRNAPIRSLTKLCMAELIVEDNFGGDDEDEQVEPGKMRVSEIKAELDLRAVSYADCFDKESLSKRLEEARATGKSDPDILKKFNKQRLEEQFSEKKPEINDETIQSAVANDGKLPGGMDPEAFKKLMGNPEIMALLQSTKMQEAMKLMMSGGQEELEEALKDDPELREIVLKVDRIVKGIQ